MKYPIYSVTIPLILGIACADHLHYISELSLTHYVVSFVVTSVVFALLHFMRRPFSATLAIMMSVYCLGCVITEMHHQSISTSIEEHTHYIRGHITAQPQQKKHTTAVELSTKKGDKVLVYIQGSTKKLKIGDFIEVFSYFGTEKTYEHKKLWGDNPTDKKDNSTDLLARYRKGLYYRGIAATCFVDSMSWQMVEEEADNSVFIKLRQMQSEMIETYHDAGIEGAEAAIIEAMTTGSRVNMSSELQQQYARAGASHVLALSGMHLSIVYGILTLLFLSGIRSMKLRLISKAMVLLAIWAFVILTGMMPSLLRAAIMFSIIEISTTVMVRPAKNLCGMSIEVDIFTDEMGRYRGINALGVSATLMLLSNPFLLMNAGFQLSYMSMLGIFACSNIMKKITTVLRFRKQWDESKNHYKRMVNELMGKVVGIVLMSIVCSVVTMPLVAYWFGSVPLMSVLTNVIIALPVSLLLVVAVVWWVVTPLTGLQAVVGDVLVFIASIINKATGWVASLPFATADWHPTAVAVVLSYVLILVVYRILTIIVLQPNKYSRQ